jgi:hypothetical protein
MNRIIEANFLPATVEEAKEKPRILIIDNNRDFTYSAKVALALFRLGRERTSPGSPNSATR